MNHLINERLSIPASFFKRVWALTLNGVVSFFLNVVYDISAIKTSSAICLPPEIPVNNMDDVRVRLSVGVGGEMGLSRDETSVK